MRVYLPIKQKIGNGVYGPGFCQLDARLTEDVAGGLVGAQQASWANDKNEVVDEKPAKPSVPSVPSRKPKAIKE